MPFVTLGPANHDALTGVSADDHHAEAHALVDHSSFSHDDLTGVSLTDHRGSAVQAQMEAETNNDNAVLPDLVRFSPGVAKVWCKANITGTIQGSHNMTSVSDDGIGLITFTFDDDFSVDTYAMMAMVLHTGGNNRIILINAAAVGSCSAEVRTDSGGGADPTSYYIAGFGDQ